MLSLVPVRRNSMSRTRENDWNTFYNLFDEFFNDTPLKAIAAGQSSFRLDVRDTEDAYWIEAEVPGVKKENIQIDYQEGYLTICVKQEVRHSEEKNDYVYRERRATSMERTLHLKDVQTEGIEANLEEGILQIKMPKSVKSNHKTTIEIK